MSRKKKVIKFVSKTETNASRFRSLLKDFDSFITSSDSGLITGSNEKLSGLVADYFRLSPHIRNSKLDEQEFLEQAFSALYRAVIITEEVTRSVRDHRDRLHGLQNDALSLEPRLVEAAILVKRLMGNRSRTEPAEIIELRTVLQKTRK